MSEELKEAFLFFFDKNRKITHKLIAFLVLIMVLWFIDTAMGISSFSFTNKKVDVVNNIYTVLNNPNVDENTKSTLTKDLKNVLNSKSIKDRIYTSLDVLPEIKYPKAKIPMNIAGNIMIKEFSVFWLGVSSVGLIVIFSVLGLFMNYKSFVNLIANIILAFCGISFLFLIINGLPLISSDKYWSNFYYQCLFVRFWVVLITIIVAVKKWKVSR